MQHIVPHLQLPGFIQVYSNNTELLKVKVVMSKSKVKGKLTSGVMLTTNWMEVVKKIDMRVGENYVFWFRGSRDGLKLLVYHL
jgi:hypothetical protein